jgi:hypothetical protein
MKEGQSDYNRPLTREEMMSALFANMVLQQTNLAMIFLGRVPHPETGEHMRDLERAQLLIDQLEMIEAKTKNNLSKQEEGILRQGLTALRMAYVEAVNEKEPVGTAEAAPKAEAKPDIETGTGRPAPEPEDTRKKFSKKY